MIHRIIFCLLCLLSTSSYSQTDSLAILEKTRGIIDTLCSDEFSGRGYIDNGHKKAADYLASRFAKMRLKPLGGTRTYFQTFPISINLPSKARLIVNGVRLDPGSDFIVNRFSGSGNIAAKVVDMGYGLKAKKSLEGKIALIRAGWPSKISNDSKKKEQYKDLARMTDRIALLLTQKPAAILILQPKLTAGFTRENLPLPILEIQQDSLPGPAKNATMYVNSELTDITSQNVIAQVQGKVSPDTALIISAHYDHMGKIENAVFAGANDNASGTSMLLSMAEYFSQPQNQPEYSLIFLAFGGEETGLIGSNYYVNQDPQFPLKQTKFILNLDLMGNGIDGIMAVGGKDYPTYFDQLVALNEKLGSVPKVRARTNAPNSDHYFFLKNGVPGFFIYTLGGPPHYHDVNDNPSTIELSKYVSVRNLLIRFLEEL